MNAKGNDDSNQGAAMVFFFCAFAEAFCYVLILMNPVWRVKSVNGYHTTTYL